MIYSVNESKDLMNAFVKLHSLNVKLHQLEIEESVFVVDKEKHYEKRLKVENDIDEVLNFIGDNL